MNLMDYPRKSASISHFKRPLSWELEGKSFELIMDDGYPNTLSFQNRVCHWTIGDRSGDAAGYWCLKADDTTYLLTFENTEEESHVYVLDLAQRLVTRLISRKGVNPLNWHYIGREYVFGAIRVPGYRLPYKRHCFTSEHLGTRVQWRWSPRLYTQHAYLESNFYRITWDEGSEASSDFDETSVILPSTDEVAQYIKIKDKMVLLSLTEEIAERYEGEKQTFRCDNLTLLQNYDRMYQVGRGYGNVIFRNKLSHVHILIASYGSPVELPERFLEAPNPFTV